MVVKTLEDKFDVFYQGERVRDKDRILNASRRTDILREKLSAKIIRKWRDVR